MSRCHHSCTSGNFHESSARPATHITIAAQASRRLATFRRGAVAAAALSFACVSFAIAPITRAAKAILDKDGRTRVILDFVETAKDSFPAAVNDKFDPRIDRHIPQVSLLIKSFEKRMNVTALTMTSWVGAIRWWAALRTQHMWLASSARTTTTAKLALEFTQASTWSP